MAGEISIAEERNAVRTLALSHRLLAHIVEYLKRSTPNERGLLFATRNGTPWDAKASGNAEAVPVARFSWDRAGRSARYGDLFPVVPNIENRNNLATLN
jgi:hypothetical protein